MAECGQDLGFLGAKIARVRMTLCLKAKGENFPKKEKSGQ